jgi:hypothetical protein
MKYKVIIKSLPEFRTILIARTVEEAKRIAKSEASLKKIKVLHSDEIEVVEIA